MLQTTQKRLLQFKALSDQTRLRLVMLCSATECSVSELTKVVRLSQPRVSQHLKYLCENHVLERFRDGHFVYYRVDDGALTVRRLLKLFPDDEPQFDKDFATLRSLRVGDEWTALSVSDSDRALHRALVELTVAQPLGDLLDIGCGQGRLLKLLASRAHRVVGVDVDSDARRFARAELLLAGTPNSTLRQGDMNALPFEDREFDTVILDDVLAEASNPVAVVLEAKRVLAPGGRLLIIVATDAENDLSTAEQLADIAAATGLRLAQPRPIPNNNPSWLLAVASAVAKVAA